MADTLDPRRPLDLVVRRLAMAGRVTDAATGRPLPGAVAQITASPKEYQAWAETRRAELASRTPPGAPPEVAVSGPDGWFRWLDLPPGKYTVDVALPAEGRRYGTARAKVEIKAGGAGWTDASVQVPPTMVSGRVRDADGIAVPMAEVRVKGSRETVHTDRDGAYSLVAIEWGSRTLQVSARGFARAEAVVKLAAAGKAKTQDFTLSPAS